MQTEGIDDRREDARAKPSASSEDERDQLGKHQKGQKSGKSRPGNARKRKEIGASFVELLANFLIQPDPVEIDNPAIGVGVDDDREKETSDHQKG